MRRLFIFSVLALTLFVFSSCTTNSDPIVDGDELNDEIGQTDSDVTETEDKKDDKVDETQKDDIVNDETQDNEVNDETNDEAQPECTKDEMKCEGTVLMWCKDGFWTTVKDCATEEKVCEVVDTTPKCVEAAETCTPDDLKCSGTKILKCNADGAWTDNQDCADDSQICENNEGVVTCEDIVVAVCDPDETKCIGDVVMKCNADGQWENETVCSDTDKICVFADDAATCEVPPCTPDAKKCSGTEVQLCNASEVWEVEIDCDLTSKVCKNNGTTVECVVPAVCVSGETDCNGNLLNLCNVDGQWNLLINCEGSDKICIKEETTASCEIAPCTPTEKKCEGKAVLTCNSGGTWDSVDCTGIQMCDDDGTTVECVDPPECSDGEKKCFGDTLMTCSSSLEWATPVNCEETQEFCDNTGAEDLCKCVATEEKCLGTEIQICNASGVWGSNLDCSDAGKICSDNGITVECKVAPVCSPAEKRCNGNLIESCNTQGQWETSSTCGGTTPTCLEITETPTCVCQDDDLRCQGAEVQKCATGVWSQETNCSLESKECRVIEETAQCATPLCTPDTKSCSGNTLLQCDSAGAWQTSDVCDDHGELCRKKDAVSQCVCNPNTKKCGERTEGNHEDYIIYNCDSNYDWVEQTDCLDDSKACNEGACVNTSCGDSINHDLIEWCDPTDPVWSQINSGTLTLACNNYWTVASGIGGTGSIKCTSDCMPDLVNCEPSAGITPYGTITAISGTIPYVLDWSKNQDSTYLGEHLDANVFENFFVGTVGSAPIPSDPVTPDWISSGINRAFHDSSDGTMIHFQDEAEFGPGENDFNWLDQYIVFLFDDSIQTGSHSVSFFSDLEITVRGVNGSGDPCIKAFGFLGSVNFSSVSGLTATDAGSYTLNGNTIYLYHPTEIPIFEDITDQLSTPACPK